MSLYIYACITEKFQLDAWKFSNERFPKVGGPEIRSQNTLGMMHPSKSNIATNVCRRNVFDQKEP